MKHNPPTALSIAITSVLCLAAGNGRADDAGSVIADGTIQIVTSQKIETDGDVAVGLHALNSGSITATDVELSTLGSGAHGALVVGRGSEIQLLGGRVEVAGLFADGLRALDGGKVVADGTQFVIRGRNAHGLVAADHGEMEISNVVLLAEGVVSHGTQASTGGRNRVIDSFIRMTGDRASAVYVESGGQYRGERLTLLSEGAYGKGVLAGVGSVVISDSSITATGNQAGGVWGTPGSDIRLEDSFVEVFGQGSYGLITQRGLISVADSTIVSTGSGGAGLLADFAGNADLTDATVSTSGEATHGIRAAAASRVEANSTGISTSGSGAFGINAAGVGSAVSFVDGSITTAGSAARAVQADDGGKVSVIRSEIQTSAAGGRDSHGVYVKTGGDAEVLDTTISTTGERSRGLLADGADSSITASNVLIDTAGYQSYGVLAQAGTRIDLDDADIMTTGQNGHGIVSLGGSTVSARNVNIETDALSSYGLSANSGGAIHLVGGKVRALGDSSLAVLAVAGTDQTTSISLENIDVRAERATAIQVRGEGINTIDLKGSRVSSGSGHLLRDALDGTGITNFTAEGSELLGDILSSDGYTLNVGLSGDTSLRGVAQNVDAMTLAGSRWDVTGDSLVGNLTASNSTVAFDREDGAFKTLTVTGDYAADNALLQINTVLGDDTSLTDRLHVLGNTSGQSSIMVNNVGGQGAETFDGIQLVQVDGTSDGVFSLMGRAVGGSYEYFLHQGGVTDPSDGDWYLRSELPVKPPVDPEVPIDPPVDPVTPVDPPVDPEAPIDPPVDPVAPITPVDPPVITPPQNVYRPETGAYLANQAAAAGMFDMTLHERLGEPNLAERLKSDDMLNSAWARTTSDHTRFNAGEGQLDVASRQSMLQVGTDFAKWGDDSRGLAGIMLATGRSSSQTTSNVTGYGAKGEVDGKALGLYATWMQSADSEKGAYLDAWLQAARFKNEVQGDALATERYDSKALMASIEAGYAMQLHEGADKAFYLEPQAQLTYTDYSMDGDQHVETNGTTVQTADAGGLQTRLGVRLYGHDTSSEGNRVQPFVAANWIHSEGDNAVAFNGVGLAGGQPSEVYELKAGAQLQMGGGWTGWGELSSLRGKNDYRNYGAQMGVKYSW